jgi:hypothetical protein
MSSCALVSCIMLFLSLIDSIAICLRSRYDGFGIDSLESEKNITDFRKKEIQHSRKEYN